MHYNPSPRALFSLIPQTMSTEVMSVLAEWPFTGARSTGTNSQGLLWALLATSSIDEISNAEDFAAVRRYITSKGVVGATGRTTVGLVFWLYPTGLHGPYHVSDERVVEQHGVLITMEPGVLIREAVQEVRGSFRTDGIAHKHIVAS